MKFLKTSETTIRKMLDQFYARWPQTMPTEERLKHCKIIAHRGDYDNLDVFENTVAAFDRAAAGGVWGVEFDLRWTKDLHPVVVHDPDLKRVFRIDSMIIKLTRSELESCCPAVPTLAEVVEKYGKKLHLMIEIKSETYPNPEMQNRALKDCFSYLEPRQDYHLMSLTPPMFDLIYFALPSTFIPIATLNVGQFSKLALEKNYGGIAGHYLLLTSSKLAKHRKKKQHVGTGYPESKNCLFREINRDVEWIFSNNACQVQDIITHLIHT